MTPVQQMTRTRSARTARKRLRVGLITTLATNFGDDLVREGIRSVLEEAFAGADLDFVAVNKHQPLTVYPEWHPVRLARRVRPLLPRGKTRIPLWTERAFWRLGLSRFDGCELIVQCGAPVLWHGCWRCEWADPLWHRVVARLSTRGVPVLNLGAGSCYPWETKPQRVEDENDAAYLRRISAYCRATTVRDELAQQLFDSLGLPVPLIPCPAILAGRSLERLADGGEFVVINYMPGGGHYDFGQGIDAASWADTVRAVAERISRVSPVLFLCHDDREYEIARTIDPAAPRLLAGSPGEYFGILSNASAAICNRLHAAVALAGIGIPSVAVGTDTRLLMVKAIGLPGVYVKEATADGLEAMLHDLLANRRRERERLIALREQTRLRHLETIETALAA